MITLDLEVRHMTFPPGLRDQASLAQKRGIIKKRVNEDLLDLFSRTSARSRKLSIRESTLEYVLSKYSEQAVFEPWRELQHWFAYTGGLFILPGYAPLDYASGRLKQSGNVSVAQAIGEAVAGLVLQWEFGGQLLARPNHD